MNQLKWKVCGMRNQENIAQVAALRPDFMGFIFYAKSPRFAADLDPVALQVLDKQTKKVAVFVNETTEEMLRIGSKYQIDYFQLHGNEAVETCKIIRQSGAKVIKAFSVGSDFDFQVLDVYKPYVDAFLFDTKGDNYGGNGVTFDWRILKKYDNQIPFFLSGGIDVENVREVEKLQQLNIVAIDVNSCFETEPGVKDVERLKRLKEILKFEI